MRALCDDLRAEKGAPLTIARKHGLRVVPFAALSAEDAACRAHISALRTTRATVNEWAYEHSGEGPAGVYHVGQELRGASRGGRVRGGRIRGGCLYTVVEGEDGYVTVEDARERTLTLTMAQAEKLLQRPYCLTNHAAQGLSLGDRVYVHDIEHRMATHRWVRTAVSRCSTLAITFVVREEVPPATDRDNLLNAARRSGYAIERHASSDRARGFEWEAADYVDPEWVVATLQTQEYMCVGCRDGLESFSIDRIVNERPHTRDNCQLVCHACQHASTHRA